MKKNDVVSKLAEVRGTTKKEAGEIVEVVLNIMKDGLKTEGIVDFYGFFKMESIYKPEHEGRNPSDGSTIMIPAKHVPKCSFSSAFKKEIA